MVESSVNNIGVLAAYKYKSYLATAIFNCTSSSTGCSIKKKKKKKSSYSHNSSITLNCIALSPIEISTFFNGKTCNKITTVCIFVANKYLYYYYNTELIIWLDSLLDYFEAFRFIYDVTSLTFDLRSWPAFNRLLRQSQSSYREDYCGPSSILVTFTKYTGSISAPCLTPFTVTYFWLGIIGTLAYSNIDSAKI